MSLYVRRGLARTKAYSILLREGLGNAYRSAVNFGIFADGLLSIELSFVLVSIAVRFLLVYTSLNFTKR